MKLIDSKEEMQAKAAARKQQRKAAARHATDSKRIESCNRKNYLKNYGDYLPQPDITSKIDSLTVKRVKKSTLTAENTFVFRKNPKGSPEKVYHRFASFVKGCPLVSPSFLHTVLRNRENVLIECLYFRAVEGTATVTRYEDEMLRRETTTYYGKEGYDGQINLSHKTEVDYVASGKKVCNTYNISASHRLFGKYFFMEKDFTRNDLSTEEAIDVIKSTLSKPELTSISQTMYFPVWRITVTHCNKSYVNFMSDVTLRMSDTQGVDGFLGEIHLPLVVKKNLRQNLVDRASPLSLPLRQICGLSLLMAPLIAGTNFPYLTATIPGGAFVTVLATLLAMAACFMSGPQLGLLISPPLYHYGSPESFTYSTLKREIAKGRLFRACGLLLNLLGAGTVIWGYLRLCILG